nr:HAMP domain-containing sensor histidine kinase [Candidatus Sigynarchaeota archaeon]
INSNKMTFKMREFDVVSIVRSTVDTLTPIASKKGHKLDLETGLRNVTMTSDPDKVEEILFNIIGNAIKYTPKDGMITVKIEDGVKDDDGMIVIKVKDNGIGISKEDLKKIFDMFWRVETDGEIKEEGTGLGLTICKNLVQGLGGRISVESELGLGSVFSIQLPKSAKQGG